MIVIIYKDKYFCGYNDDGTAWLDKNIHDVWQFKTIDEALDEATRAKLKISKCRFKQI